MMKQQPLDCLLKSILAGFFIGIGGLAFLSLDNKIIGAMFFTVGLFVILTFKLNLFTGKLCYMVESNNYANVGLILLGNFIGTLILAILVRLTSLNSLTDRAIYLWELKLNDSLLSLFIKGILCNILIYLAVEGFNKLIPMYAVPALFFGVVIFILCGFEHSVADMFYLNLSGAYSWVSILRLFVIILGNLVGGVGIRFLMRYQK